MNYYTVTDNEGGVFQIDVYRRENIEALKERLRLGNQKLNDAWYQLVAMDHSSEEWNMGIAQWHKANQKLSLYCDQVKELGFEDCLYLNKEGKKTRKCLGEAISCRVCPSRTSYWETELMDLPSASDDTRQTKLV